MQKEGSTLEERLIKAIWSGRSENIKKIMNEGPNLNYIDSNGNNIIDLTVRHNRNNALIIFLLGQMNKDALNYNGLTLFRYIKEFRLHSDRNETAHFFLERGFNPESIDENGNSLYHYPLGIKFFKELHKKGVNIDKIGVNGRTPIQKYLKVDFLEYINFFLENGANPNHIDSNGYNCLHIFLEEIKQYFRDVPIKQRLNETREENPKDFKLRHFEEHLHKSIKILKLLFSYNTDTEVETEKLRRLINDCYCTDIAILFLNNGYNSEKLIRMAVKYSDFYLLEYLVVHGYVISKTTLMKIFKLAIESKSIKLLDASMTLLKEKKEIIAGANPYLEEALRCRNVEIVELFLKHSLVPKSPKITIPMQFMSVESCNELMFNKIFALDSCITYANEAKETLLFLAVKNRDASLVENLLNKGFDTNVVRYDGKTPLYFAVTLEDKKILKQLIVGGANVNKKLVINNKRHSLLEMAVKSGNREIVHVLLSNRANPNELNGDNRTPLHFACRSADIELIDLLFSFGSDVNNQIEYMPVIEEAYSQKNINLVKILLENGADPNTRLVNSYKRNTILIQSILNRWINLSLNLIKLGADPSLTNDDGNNALHAAYKENIIDVIRVLEESNPNLSVKNNEGIKPNKINRSYR